MAHLQRSATMRKMWLCREQTSVYICIHYRISTSYLRSDPLKGMFLLRATDTCCVLTVKFRVDNDCGVKYYVYMSTKKQCT
jgi:hypothetical protein